MKLWTRVVSCRNAVWEMAPDVDGIVRAQRNAARRGNMADDPLDDEQDDVAVLNQGDRTADLRLRRDVSDAEAV